MPDQSQQQKSALLNSVLATIPPKGSYLSAYSGRDGAMVDCYRATAPRTVSLPEHITAFCNSPVFRLERMILRAVGAKDTSPTAVNALAHERPARFGCWSIEGHSESELIMKVDDRPIRTWLHVAPNTDDASHTDLYFGSAFTPPPSAKKHNPQVYTAYRLMMPAHYLYSRILLRAAPLSL